MIIMLFGISNVGKTVTGEKLAQKLNYSFLDMDEEIKKRFQTTLEKFMQDHPISYERGQIKGKLLKDLMKEYKDNIVIAVSSIFYARHFNSVLNKVFDEVAILQKCFCDIPFHKLTDNFELNVVGEVYKSLNDDEKLILKKNNTHPDYYGKFAIAFSKSWGEGKNLQPVHYLNENSLYTVEFTKLFDSVLSADSIPEEYVSDILNRVSFVKSTII